MARTIKFYSSLGHNVGDNTLEGSHTTDMQKGTSSLGLKVIETLTRKQKTIKVKNTRKIDDKL